MMNNNIMLHGALFKVNLILYDISSFGIIEGDDKTNSSDVNTFIIETSNEYSMECYGYDHDMKWALYENVSGNYNSKKSQLN